MMGLSVIDIFILVLTILSSNIYDVYMSIFSYRGIIEKFTKYMINIDT